MLHVDDILCFLSAVIGQWILEIVSVHISLLGFSVFGGENCYLVVVLSACCIYELSIFSNRKK